MLYRDAAAHQRGDLRLVQPEQFAGAGLRELSLGDRGSNPADEFRLGESDFGIGKPEVGEYIVASSLDARGSVIIDRRVLPSAARFGWHGRVPLDRFPGTVPGSITRIVGSPRD
ncbi:MAG: hypothetical protein WD066_16715 [Planctomycetaceae bacterium]